MSSKLTTPKLLASSRNANWQGISLEHYLFPAYETSEYTLEQHHLCIYLGKPLIYEQIIKGKLRSQNCIYGDMVFYPVGMTQKLAWNKEAEIIQLDIEPEFISQAYPELCQSNKLELIPQYAIRDPLIQQLALTLVNELQQNNNQNLYTESLFQTLSLHLLKNFSQSSITIEEKSEGLPAYLNRRLDEYIQENLEQNLSLAQMAKVVNLSTSHLNKLFKQSQGVSLYQYVIHCRITRAKRLLTQKKLTLAEIATQVGFNDQSHFTHHFKKQVGITPKVFRQL